MTDTNEPGSSEIMGGKKFLYEKPELLNTKDHSALGFTPPERPFDHVKSVRAIPLTMVEFSTAQRHYPIMFSNLKDPVPLAVVGLEDDNLFVDGNGAWDPECYVPSYLRCYPFAFATAQEGQMAVIVDRAAASVTENPKHPFFVDDKVSEHTDALMRFCGQYDVERRRTKELCDKLVELELLAPLRATYTPAGSSEQKTLADYVGVNSQKLNELGSDVIHDLHKSGRLSAIYLQHYSLENWRYLRARSVRAAK